MLSRPVVVIFTLALLFIASSAIAAPLTQPPARDIDFPTIFLRAPLESAVLPAGSEQSITWTYSDFPGPTVKIILLKNDTQVLTVATGVLIDNQSFRWKIPADLAPGKDYQLRIISERYNYCKSTSDKFSITSP